MRELNYVPAYTLKTAVRSLAALPTMSAIRGNSVNIYSLRVLPHVTQSRQSARVR